MSSAWAILVAGGSGSRLGAALPKQFLPLAGRRVIDHVLDRFLGNKLFQGLVLVVPQEVKSGEVHCASGLAAEPA